LLVKGILDPADAERAVRVGADGIVVSNHGGRQLNPTMSAIEALPAVVDRVAAQVPVLVDGGIRCGSDVAVALALGAKACLVGRPALYGLAGRGPAGAAAVLRLLGEELERTLVLMGLSSTTELDRARLVPRRGSALGT
jgi:L-lactate dehydrogenase (cytochrome)/(S)-mandelate dehydrogenase